MNKEVVFISGASRGIGTAIAKNFADLGHTVIGTSRSSFTFDTKDKNLIPISLDITNRESIAQCMNFLKENNFTPSVLINNAGIGSLTTVEKETDEIWHKVLNINVVGTARVSRAAIALLRESKSAAIVNTASVAAIDGIPNRAAYSASKGAILSLTLAMATDHLADGIRVNAVNPATTDTPWVKKLLDQSPDAKAARSALESRQPMGRLVSPSKIASAIIFLASPVQASVTGTTLNVDGGMHSLRIPK